MRIADSTVNMLSGRNYTQTGMRNGGSYGSSFMGMISSFDMKKSGSMTRDTYQTDKNNNGMNTYNMDDIGYFKGLGKIASGSLFGTSVGASSFQNNTLDASIRKGLREKSAGPFLRHPSMSICFFSGSFSLSFLGRVRFNTPWLKLALISSSVIFSPT